MILRRGHQLVFNYPPPQFQHTQHAHSSEPTASPTNPHHTPLTAHSANRQSQTVNSNPSAILGFDPHFLSDILSPKVALCDKQFQLSIDDITFLGHPTLINADRPGTGHRFARMIQRKRLADMLSRHDNSLSSHPTASTSTQSIDSECYGEYIWDDHVDFDTGTIPEYLDIAKNSHSVGIGGILNQKNEIINTSSNSTNEMSGNTSIGTSIKSNQSPSANQQLTMFNLVFAIKPLSRKGFYQRVDSIYNNILARLTAALKYEQLKRGYIKREAEIIMAIKEGVHAGMAGILSDEVMSAVLQKSSLARLLAHTFHSIQSNDICHLMLNSSIDLSLQIPKQEEYPSNGFGYVDPDSETFTQTKPFPILRPYHALLLLSHPEELLKSLPLDPSPLLYELIEILTPTQSLEDLAATLSCTLSQIYRLAAHLIYWKRAKVIDVVHPRNIYVLSKTANLSLIPTLEQDFSKHIPGIEFTNILAELSSPRPFSTIFRAKELKAVYMESIYLVIPKRILNSIFAQLSHTNHHTSQTTISELPSSSQRLTKSSSCQYNEDTILCNPSGYLSDFEKACVQAIALHQPASIAAMFLKLVPYFNGTYHAEEIIFRESIPRKDFKLIISRYREFLLTKTSFNK